MIGAWLALSALADPLQAALGALAPAPGVSLSLSPVRFAGGHRVIARAHVDGRPVIGGAAVVRLDPRSRVRGRIGPSLPAALWRARLSAQEAIVAAEGAAGGLGLGRRWPSRAQEAWLWRGQHATAVFAVSLSTEAPWADWRILVDAADGRILELDRTSRTIDGHVYPSNPVRSELQRTALPGLLSERELIGRYASAVSCGDWEISESLFGVTRCHATEQQARPDAGGHYLFEPDPLGALDPLVEVQAYFHTDRIASWADETFGLALPQGSIRTLSNFPMRNAFYGDFDGDGVPDLSLGQDPGSGVDLGYDADVIYHEFGHALVATLAPDLPLLSADAYGIEWAPGSLNEGAADVFAMLMTLDPQVGEHAGGAFGREAIRDLSEPRRCPDDLRGEVHRDGEILASLGWALIDDPRVGPEVTAELWVGSIPLWGSEGTWPRAGSALRDTAADLLDAGAIDDATHATILAHLQAANLSDCGRVIPLDGGLAPDLYLVTGGLQGELERLPGGVQLSLEIPPHARRIALHVRDFTGPEGMGWALYGRYGRPIEHEVTSLELLGLGFAVPSRADWVVDGGVEASTLSLSLDSTPPLVPGQTLYLSVASRNTGGLQPLAFELGKITVSAEVIEPPGEVRSGCASGGSAPLWWLALWAALAARTRRTG